MLIYILMLPNVLPKTELSISLKKSFSKLFFPFFLSSVLNRFMVSAMHFG